jgi:tRNA(Ile2) C34 agmatinyltransferase TiaS
VSDEAKPEEPRCAQCGSLMKVVGRTTLHYECPDCGGTEFAWEVKPWPSTPSPTRKDRPCVDFN